MGDAKDVRKPWYSNGLRFKCQRTGACCSVHGEYSRVYLNDQEAEAAAEILKLPLTEFEERFCIFEDGLRQFDMSKGVCPMLKGVRCRIYQARPVQCRTWPFWHENLQEDVWERDIVPFCKGVGRGRLLSQEEIDAMADEMDEQC